MKPGLLFLTLLTVCSFAQGPDFRPRSREQMKKRMQERVEGSGVQEGAMMPDVQVHDLDGKPMKLATLWRERPLVLVTASITCPVAVDQCPTLKSLIETHRTRANVVILYVREAHPAPDGTPQRAEASGHASQPQPLTFEDRLKLARSFAKQFSGGAPVLVAAIDNAVIAQLGTGPNSALLIDTQGRLAAKHGWYEPELMTKAIAELKR